MEDSLCSHELLVKLTRNAPSAGTERIDRIGNCQSSFRDVIVFSSYFL